MARHDATSCSNRRTSPAWTSICIQGAGFLTLDLWIFTPRVWTLPLLMATTIKLLLATVIITKIQSHCLWQLHQQYMDSDGCFFLSFREKIAVTIMSVSVSLLEGQMSCRNQAFILKQLHCSSHLLLKLKLFWKKTLYMMLWQLDLVLFSFVVFW